MLAAIAILIQTANAPAVELNHFFVTVDRQTWKAIQSNQWLKDNFASVSTSTNSSGKETWTGIYVYGVGSYVEIFAAEAQFKKGQAGLGFLTPTPGGVDSIDFLFRKGHFGKRAVRELMQLGSKEKQEPFSHIATYSGQDPALSVWLMEYHEERFRELGVPVGSTQAQMTAARRRKNNRPYQKLMEDVTCVTVTRGRPDLDHALAMMGFQKQTNGWKRGRSEIRFAPRADFAITEARFSLRKRPSKPHTESFGPRCRLTIDLNGTAVWKFG